MPDYPRAFQIEPLPEWPGEQTSRREQANFRSPGYKDDATGRWVPAQRTKLSKTMRELQTEFEAIKATNPRLLLPVLSTDITLDGRLKAKRTPWHPGVVLVFDTPRGEQRYPSDQYTHWEDNLRAIVLTLNALRGIERWGVGDVRSSYLAIESAHAMPPAPFTREPHDVLRWLAAVVLDGTVSASTDPRTLIRRAQRTTHPDTGGDRATWDHVNTAEVYLREAGLL